MMFVRNIKFVSITYTILVNLIIKDDGKSKVCKGEKTENIIYNNFLILKTLHPLFKLLNH